METRTIRLLHCLIFSLLALCFHSQAVVSENLWLEQGQSELRNISKNDTHIYQLKLAKVQFFAGFAFQKSADVMISIFDPSGNQVGIFDQFLHNKEPFHFKTKLNGVYQVKVNTSSAGLYSIGLVYPEAIAITDEDKMQQMMAHYLADEPGGGVAVVKDGKTVFSQSYGLANVEYDIPNDLNTPFQLASASKPFASFAVAMLAEQKNYRWTMMFASI